MLFRSKVIELYFKLGDGCKGEWSNDPEEQNTTDVSQYQGCLDWINDAPFGVIKRAHKRMVDGMSADEIYKLAISETIRKAVNNPDQADIAMHQMFREIEDGSSIDSMYDVWKIREIIRLARKLSRYSEELSYSELESMSGKDMRWIDDEKYSKINTLENILCLAQNNLEVDVFLRAINAGFSVDEIKLYPFLASDLLIKERDER